VARSLRPPIPLSAVRTVLTHLAFSPQREPSEFFAYGWEPVVVNRPISYRRHPETIVMVLLEVCLRPWAHAKP
jgi:hypothetical protein